MNQTNTISVSGIGHYAVKYYCANWHSKMAMIRKYGKINDWDVSIVDHPRVLYVDTIYSEEDKDMFIRTCDAMIHARRRGESFGLSIAEFSITPFPDPKPPLSDK